MRKDTCTNKDINKFQYECIFRMGMEANISCGRKFLIKLLKKRNIVIDIDNFVYNFTIIIML